MGSTSIVGCCDWLFFSIPTCTCTEVFHVLGLCEETETLNPKLTNQIRALRYRYYNHVTRFLSVSKETA